MSKILPRSFYTRATLQVSRDLLGKYLVYKNKSGRICEVEAYIGQNDKACHASRGLTKRNQVMYKTGGFSYVYIIYGIYNCLNITTEIEGFPAAVLIRSIELPNANGPGKLCRELNITRVQNGLDVTKGPIYIEDRYEIVGPIAQTPRIGVDYAGKDAILPWRFCLANSQFLSRKLKLI